MRIKLRWYLLLFVAIAALALALFWFSGAQAQAPGGYDCHFVLGVDLKLSGQCVPVQPQEPLPTETPTPIVVAPTETPSATPTTTQTPAPAVDLLHGVAILGDSFFDEYRADNNRGGAYAAGTFNAAELMVRLRGLNLGSWGTWGEPRRTGYEYNWARSGATSYTMIQQGQHLGAAAQIQAGKVTFVLIGIGANDFSPHFGDAYRRIYDGSMSDAELQAKIARAIADVTTAVDTVRQAGARGVALTLFTQWELDPTIATDFPDAAKRRRVVDAIDAVNAGLTAMASSRGVALIDQNAFGMTQILPYLDEQGFFSVGGERIDFLHNGDEPHHAKLADGSHVGTVMSGLVANYYFVDMLQQHFGVTIPRLTDAEILQQAGIVPAAGPTPTSTPTLPPAPTATPTETPTVIPSATPIEVPSATPTPTIAPTEEFSGALEVTTGGAMFWGQRFGANQEIYVTIQHMEWQTQTAGLALLLLSQSRETYTAGAVGVAYMPELDQLYLYHYAGGKCNLIGSPKTGVVLWPGDVFGARINGNTVTAYVNGVERARGTVNWAQWPGGKPSSGYVGLAAEQMAGTRLDDFGGGTLP